MAPRVLLRMIEAGEMLSEQRGVSRRQNRFIDVIFLVNFNAWPNIKT
jgi:hypothetical protein